ncbi:cytokine receptor-like isoform X1 [Macrosteles quadrilineatus]|uniref:cytokine receptor-like isoform X1 n=1 Tax=Macrosteles quadrilineatus TaxID=74068 RepID=UPI0023E2DCA6|nr:cytokine receptor-like isoform X1 [Macrosteles quadrilineatus]
MERLLCSRTWVVVLFVVVVAEAETDDRYRCSPGITTPGVTLPAGDIILKYGQPLEIFCELSPSVVAQGFNSSSLVFYHTSYKVMPEFISIVNESTARLYIEKPVPMKDMYYCKLINGTEESPVCLNSVAVGFEPEFVKNFSCVSHNWDNLNCTWVTPNNFVKTKYTLVYQLPGRAGGRLKFPCPDETDVNGKNYCFYDQTTSTPYRQPYEYYSFLMTGENRFGVKTQRTRFHHYAYVIPAKAANLTMLEKTSSSVLIQWSVVFPMQNFPPGVEQKVEYQSEWDPRDHWTVVNMTYNIKNATHQVNITGLKYANSIYDLRVFMRSPLALGEDMWSQPATLTIKTKPTIPGAAPKTDIGSFEVTTVSPTSRDVYVYWQNIPEYLYNGDHFKYKVTVEEDGVPRNLDANETTSAYAKFRGLSMNSYRFRIISTNIEGESEDYSEVFVPSPSQLSKSLAEPLSFTKIAFDHHIYELSWKPPITTQPISNYTIFWCDNKKDRPYQCTGTLNWTWVSKDVTIKNITVPDEKIYQFAISANTETESSGMVWASCTVIHNRILGKMKTIWINRVGPTFIEVGWKLECSDRIGVVTGFQIYYCPIVSPHNTKCKVEAKNTTIAEGLAIRGNVTDLTPYTTYMVMVAVITKHSIGQWSDRQYNTTLEAAPDMPPQNVSLSEVTNTSMLVQWSPPLSMNGVLRYYLVHYNGLSQKVEGSQQNPIKQVRLRNLDSYVVYNVSVQACTVACSQRSTPLQARTKIGIPGKMDRPMVKFVNSSQVEVLWKPPIYAAGLLDKYEVLNKVIGDEHNLTEVLNCTGECSERIFRTSGNQSLVPVEDCNSGGPHHTYSFSVRAVNFDDDTVYYGPWSEPGEGSCYSAGAKEDFWIIVWVVVCLVLVFVILAVAFLGKRLWRCYEQMKEVEVKLPPGLAPAIEKSSDPDYHTHLSLYGWGQKPPLEEKQDLGIATPDQELLLQKKGGVVSLGERRGEDLNSLGEGDGDSSGCSSGHESVASSLTHGTHISSDSGTEADQLHSQRATSLDGVFHDGSPPTSLRQRNKASSSTSSESSSGRWERGEPYVMLGGSTSCLVKSSPNLTEVEGGVSGYSMLGTAWRPTPTATGYVSLPPTVTPAHTYVPHPPLKAEPIPSKGYVMAGETTETPQYCRLGHSDYIPHRQLDGGL